MTSYANRPWTKSYDAHVKPSLAPYPEYGIPHFLKTAAQQAPDNIALVTSTRLPSVLGNLGRLATRLTYAELDRTSDALAVALIEMGVKKGDRVAVVMPNIAAFVISFWAILKAGGVIAAANPTYPADKLKFQINDSDAKICLCMSLYYNTIQSIRKETQLKHVIVANIKEYLPGLAKTLFSLARERKEGHRVEALAPGDYAFQALLGRYAGQTPNVTVKGNDLALFQYTGGTTGVAKAAMSRHSALVANSLQCENYLLADSKDSFLGAIPMFHVFGMVAVLMFATALKAPIYLVPNAREISDVLDTINTYQPSIFMGVPALYNAIRLHPKVTAGEVDLSSIRACISGSAPLAPSTKVEFEKLSGGRLMEGFGMSETPTATFVNPLKGENRTGSIGLPLPDVDVRIVSLDDGETEMPMGEPGELLVSAPQNMVGYHKMPTETANALREKDGKLWLYTGDIARMDENGYFYIVDRKKDMALIGGFNVYPNMVEKVIAEHPAVAEVGVAAIPHPQKVGQESLKAWVVLKEGQSVTEQALIEHQETKLAGYEVARRFSFVRELPKTAVGKTLRRELIQMETAAAEGTPQA
ncbi:MAG: AMP-binding protein [Phototrophicaceae bacterium]|jgi:long-chain acyl-CoA synthetase